jgi:CIC family chloride channel protein
MSARHLDLRGFLRALTIGPVERQLLIVSVVVGIMVWPIVYTLKELVHWLFHEILHMIEESPTPLVMFVPLLIGAVITAFVAQRPGWTIPFRAGDGKDVEELNAVAGDGIERTIALYAMSDTPLASDAIGMVEENPRLRRPTFRLAVRKWVATLATLGTGGSGGLEGSAALIGESVGAGTFQIYQSRFQKRWGVSKADLDDREQQLRSGFLQTAQIAGVGAAVTVLIGAPLTASFFATEIMYRDKPLFSKLLYAVISSLTAYSISFVLVGPPRLFEIDRVPVRETGFRTALFVVVVAAAVTAVGQIYRVLSQATDRWFHTAIRRPLQRHLTGAGIVGLIALVTVLILDEVSDRGDVLPLVLGSGESSIVSALELLSVGELAAWVAVVGLVAGMLATLVTIGSGGSAGLLVPSLYFATMVAVIIGQISGIAPMTLAPPAMTAALVSIAGTPIAGVTLIVEVFGSSFVIPGLLALVVAYLMAHPNSVYRTQGEAPNESEILPGMEVRRLTIPESMAGRSLEELDLDGRFGVSVIGLYPKDSIEDAENLRAMEPEMLLQFGDTLALTGSEAALEALNQAVNTAMEG